MKWYLEDIEGWRPIGVQGVNIPIVMGTAVHAGMAALWRTWSQDRMIEAAMNVLTSGAPITELAGLCALLAKILGKAYDWCEASMGHAEVIMVEQSLRENGITPDLITREHGDLVVTDWKYHHKVKREHLHYRLDGPERNHQFLHYVWDVGEYLGRAHRAPGCQERVRLFRRVSIVGTPQIIVKDSIFVPTEPMMTAWLQQAKRKWHEMDQTIAAGTGFHGNFAYRREDGCMPYGAEHPCEMWAACWTCHGNREQMSNFYTKEMP